MTDPGTVPEKPGHYDRTAPGTVPGFPGHYGGDAIPLSRALLRSLEALLPPDSPPPGLLLNGPLGIPLYDLALQHLDPPPIPCFVDTGLYPPEVHELLHDRYRSGHFPLRFFRNDPALQAARDGLLHLSQLPPDQLREARMLTRASNVAYNASEPAVRLLLWEVPFRAFLAASPCVLLPTTWGEEPERAYFERQGGTLIVRPLLHWLGRSVSCTGPSGDTDRAGDGLIDRAMQMDAPAREAFLASHLPPEQRQAALQETARRLALWKSPPKGV